MSKVKLTDVAKAAGVSIGTVSRALRGKTKGHWARSAVQMQKINELAKEMGYQPNRAAQVMRTRRTNQICLLTGELYNPYTGRTLEIIGEELDKRGYGMLLRLIRGDRKQVSEKLASLSLDFADGIISNHPLIEGKELEKQISPLPVVTLDRSPEYSPAILNMEGGVLMGLQHLWGLGHRRIAMVIGGKSDDSKLRRVSGYKAFFASQGQNQADKWIIQTGWDYESGEEALEPFLKTECTACLAGNDLLAVGLCTQLRIRGYQIPKDFSLMSMDDTILTQINRPQLTSLQPPIRELVTLSIDGLLRKIEGEHASPFQMLMPDLVIRESTASPSR